MISVSTGRLKFLEGRNHTDNICTLEDSQRLEWLMSLRPCMKVGIFLIIKGLLCLNSFSMTHTLILLELIQVYTVHTTYIINLKYKCNFVTYINFHSSFIITKFKMNSYETTVSANRVWDIHCVRGLSQDSTDHTGGIQPIFLPLGRPELQHFC